MCLDSFCIRERGGFGGLESLYYDGGVRRVRRVLPRTRSESVEPFCMLSLEISIEKKDALF